ncbi:MAG: P-II family nitrogen regulator [Candidatus Izemoplasmatales bacterium]|jgi:nitrogen regulatory protein PII
MKLVIYVMTQTKYLDDFLTELNKNGIKGATIISSTGMARTLAKNDDMPMFGSLKYLFENHREESNVILIALKDDKVETVFKVIEGVCGKLEEPDSGIAFTVPIDEIVGCKL